MKKRKFKRYQEGGMTEEQAKAKGLEASKNEKVGFFERLRMGNIDDPKSEAYKRFGAGRGRVPASAPVPMMPSAPATAMPEASVQRMGMAPQMESPLAPPTVAPETSQKFPLAEEIEKTTVATPRKKATQTKKVVAKPAPKKASAPDESAAETSRLARQAKPSTKASESRSGARTRAGTPVPSDNTGKLAAVLAGVGAGGLGLKGLRQRLMRPDVGGGSASRDAASSMGNRPRLMGIDPSMESDLERMAGEGGPNFRKGGKAKAKPVMKYASGGMVGKASTRADGIAKRGKTKCKVY